MTFARATTRSALTLSSKPTPPCLNPKPSTLNAKPETLNPRCQNKCQNKPQTLNAKIAHLPPAESRRSRPGAAPYVPMALPTVWPTGPLCPHGITYRTPLYVPTVLPAVGPPMSLRYYLLYGFSTCGSFKQSLCSPLCEGGGAPAAGRVLTYNQTHPPRTIP